MRFVMSGPRRLGFMIPSLLLFAAFICRAAPDIPVVPGMVFTIAVSNAPSQRTVHKDAAQGDYETIVTITEQGGAGIGETAYIDGVDGFGKRKQVLIPRQVRAADLTNSHLQILGFHTDDPLTLPGTTSLGPSLAMVRELLGTGSTGYSFRNFAVDNDIKGTLTRADPAHVKFPVLLNGQRVELDAIRTTFSSPGSNRPYEQLILDHPLHPVSLRIAWGPKGSTFPFVPDFARDIVRIDFPVTQGPTLEAALGKDCHVEVPGIYFDFNEATLKPISMRALTEIAATLRKHPQWRISIEGHTDNIGGERYNDQLSLRRAAAVKTALQNDLQLTVANIATKGWGLHRPVETNETLAGRARNRRVELVRECVP
jgi:hypothetical protein